MLLLRLGQRPGGAIQRLAVAGSTLVSLWGCLNAGNGSGLSSGALSKEMEPSATSLPLRGQTLPVSLPLTSETGCYCSSLGQLHGERRNCMNETCC